MEALCLVVYDVDVEAVPALVDALEEFPAEELDPHDGEYEPEHEADKEDVDDGGDRVHQSIDNNLRISKVNMNGEYENDDDC